MAHKVEAPIVPISIVASGKAHPSTWMFPRMMCRGVCKVVIHEPVESKGRTEKELGDLVRKAIIDGLPENQHPFDDE
jgi:1-acyl-sn-glycerol-3-phosphate acyltransferase